MNHLAIGHAAPNEGKLAGLTKWCCNKTACLTDGSGRPGGCHIAEDGYWWMWSRRPVQR